MHLHAARLAYSASGVLGHPRAARMSGFPPWSPLQDRVGRRRSGASLLSSGSPFTTSSGVQAPRGAGRPREATPDGPNFHLLHFGPSGGKACTSHHEQESPLPLVSSDGPAPISKLVSYE